MENSLTDKKLCVAAPLRPLRNTLRSLRLSFFTAKHAKKKHAKRTKAMEFPAFQDNFKSQTPSMKFLVSILFVIINAGVVISQEKSQATDTIPLLVKKCLDFEPTGAADNKEWN